MAKYKAVIMQEELTLLQMRMLQYEALGALSPYISLYLPCCSMRP